MSEENIIILAQGNTGGRFESRRPFHLKIHTNTEGAMALGIVPNGIKVEMNYIQNGVPVVNRFFVTKTSAPSSADLDDAITATLAFYNDLKAHQHSSLVLQNITATDVSVANGTQTILPLTTANQGTGAGGPAAANAALCVSLRTNFTGRSFRGRMYLGGLVQGELADAQNFGASQAATIAGIVSDFIDALTAINQTLVVVSNYASGVVRAIALATEIISIIVDTKLDSQRRRTAN